MYHITKHYKLSERFLYQNIFHDYMVKLNIELMMSRNVELKNVKIGPKELR